LSALPQFLMITCFNPRDAASSNPLFIECTSRWDCTRCHASNGLRVTIRCYQPTTNRLFVWLINHQTVVLFFHNKLATSH
jgi:hypothetical protein